MIRRLILASALLPFVAVAISGQTPSKTTNDGVYTAAQAERGKKTFTTSCTTCHDTDRFSGATFAEAWTGKPLKEIWDVASGTMPEDNPGSLKQQEYADIIAYFLSLNQYPPGETELAPGAGPMGSIKVEKKK